MINVGFSAAIISSPTPPTRKDVIWHEQTDPVTDVNIGLLRYYDHNSNQWLVLQSGGGVLVREQITISTNGQTSISLLNNVISPTLSTLFAMGCHVQYGTAVAGGHYTISGNTLTWTGDATFTLIAGEKLDIYYYI